MNDYYASRRKGFVQFCDENKLEIATKHFVTKKDVWDEDPDTKEKFKIGECIIKTFTYSGERKGKNISSFRNLSHFVIGKIPVDEKKNSQPSNAVNVATSQKLVDPSDGILRKIEVTDERLTVERFHKLCIATLGLKKDATGDATPKIKEEKHEKEEDDNGEQEEDDSDYDEVGQNAESAIEPKAEANADVKEEGGITN